MAISRFSTSSVAQGLPKYQKVWDGISEVVASDYELIERVTLSSNTSSVTFSSIPQTYKHLQIRALAKWTYSSNSSPDSSAIGLRFNSDSGNNYSLHYLMGTGSAASTYGTTSLSKALIGASTAVNSYSGYGNIYGISICDILDYTNTSKYKTVKATAGVDVNGSGGNINLISSLWVNSSAITSIEVVPDYPSWVQHSTFGLYGIKGAA